ncbi:MAG: Spi family protease inhibitor [Prevotella sp.]|nr:Spi family protease inhibitor [Bacteroides sp.]MCM1367053.1 Spi family protease inhibitor [Prevotella sp.]
MKKIIIRGLRISEIIRFLLIVILSIFSIVAKGETVSQKQAMDIAQRFYNAAHKQVMASPKVVYNGRRLTTQSLFVPFYVYNFPAGGYVIVSAENKAFPILGYNLKEGFDDRKLGEREKGLLRSYAQDIERIRYDSRIPYSAIESWGDIDGYIVRMLESPYEVTDVLIDEDEVKEGVDRIVDRDLVEYSSMIYSPDQWQEAIDRELYRNGNVILGLYDGKGYEPMVVQGHKGDYYRFSLDGINSGMYRLFATEYFSDGQVAQLGSPKVIEDVAEEDDSFKFYEEFVSEIRAAEDNEQKRLEGIGVVTEPETSYLGGGHYVIKLPEDIIRLNLYNVGGALIGRQYYKGTDTAHIDLSIEPSGFYIALIEGESGSNYGIKLAR